MDVDEDGSSSTIQAATSTSGAALDEQVVLKRLEELAAKPYDYALHLANIRAAGDDEEREDARKFMAQMLPLTEELWLDWIKDKTLKFEESDQESSLEAAVEVLELYKRACGDYLSMRIRRNYAHFVVKLWYTMRGYSYPDVLEEGLDAQQPDPTETNEVGTGVFTEDFVREELEQAVSSVARYHLSEVGERKSGADDHRHC